MNQKTTREVQNVRPDGGHRVPILGAVTLSPDGQRVVYELGWGGFSFSTGYTTQALRRVVLDGQVGKEYDAFDLDEFSFSDDSRHFAYEVHGPPDKNAKGKSLVVTDGQEGKLYDEVIHRSMSLFSGEGSVTYVAREGRKFYRATQSAR